jgi:histone-lysine N-methyltransferase SETD3
VVAIDSLGRNCSDLFLATGVVDQTHVGDFLVMTASTVNTDKLFDAKRQILEGMGMSADSQAFPVFADRMPLQMLAYLRFARVKEPSELMTVSFEEDRIVSPMNEYEVLQLLMGDAREFLGEYENSSEEFELLQLKEKGLSSRAYTAARVRLQEKKLMNATTNAVRRRLAPIRGIPTKQGMEDPNADLLEIFDAIENLPNKPKQMYAEFKKWARGDYEEKNRGPKGGGGSGCG